jgi:hypothetical protein
MSDVAYEGTREALKRLQDAYNRYEGHATPGSRDTLLGAAKTAEAWLTTLTAVDHVDQGWDA